MSLKNIVDEFRAGNVDAARVQEQLRTVLRTGSVDAATVVRAAQESLSARNDLPEVQRDQLRTVLKEAEAVARINTQQISGNAATVQEPGRNVLKPGAVLKQRFVIECKIGEGGMGVVYKARDLRKDEAQDRNPFVAVKVLGDDFKSHPDALIALQREARRAQDLAHPNIVTVYDFDRDGDTLFVTMELLEGQPLDKFIEDLRGAGLSLQQALPIIDGMASALAYAHRKRLVHCDFKPNNVFITADRTIKVLDFGIARVVQSPTDTRSVFDAGQLNALTPPYASCEMIERLEPDPRDDLYALACITYELLTGRHPFKFYPATQARKLGLDAARVAGLPVRAWRVLQSGLAFERARRPANAEEFLRAFQPRQKTVRPVFWFGLSTAVIISVGLTFFGVRAFFPKPNSAAQQESAPSRVLTADEQAKIVRLAETGELQMETGFLVSPPGANALEVFMQIVELDPANARARDALKRIASETATRVAQQMQTLERKESLRLIELGLQANPADAELKKLKELLAKSAN